MLILFTSPYRSFTDNLSEMNKITPGNSGIWKTLKGTDDINNFDYIIILDNIDKHLEKLGKDNFMKLINNALAKVCRLPPLPHVKSFPRSVNYFFLTLFWTF